MPPETTGVDSADVVRRRIRGSGLDLAIVERGDPSRATVVLVHGFPDSSAAWDPVAERMAPELHVVAYDVRGAGASDAPAERSAYALPLLVEDMAAVIDVVSPDAPVHLVGHDWGSIQGWEAVTSDRLAGRIASYTSISGPPLDHAALWARRHRTTRPADLRAALGQAARSWYIAAFHLPYLPEVIGLGVRAQRNLAGRRQHRGGTAAGEPSDASTRADDFRQGLQLYRANVLPRLRHPVAGHTETPIQIIVPLGDRFISPALLDGLAAWSPVVWRRDVDAGHWIIKTHPGEIAGWVRQVITFVESGQEAEELARCRVTPSRPPDPVA
jgi:pimeloyl-ACP methyl ester carboxylesterase